MSATVEAEMAEFTMDYIYLASALHITNPMSIENFLNPVEENVIHHVLSDAEILIAAQTVEEEDKEQEEVEVAAFMKLSFSMKDKLTVCSTILLVLEDESNCEKEEVQGVIQTLRMKQRKLQRKIAVIAALSAMQPKISEYFS